MRKPFSTEMLPRHRQLIEDALEIKQEEARAAGALGCMARTLAQAVLLTQTRSYRPARSTAAARTALHYQPCRPVAGMASPMGRFPA